MNTELKITKGEWRVDDSGYLSQGGGICIMNGNECLAIVGDYNPHHPIKENAKLIANAGNTIQSCGLLPSQLLKQNNEMRAFLNKINYDYEAFSDLNSHGYGEELEKLIESTNP